MNHAPEPNPGLVFDLMTSYHKTAALRAGVELGLFAALGDRARGARELALDCSTTPRGMRILCDYLTILGLLAKEGDSYSNTPTSGVFLDPGSPACIASTVHFLNNPELMEPFQNLTQVIRQGYTTMPGEGSVSPENPLWVEFARNMAPMMAPLAGPLGELVLKGSRQPMRVLDVAAGHGLFGIEVAKRNPQAHVVAVDWAAVLEVARGNAERAGVASRYQLKPGSAFDVDFQGPYDIVLLTNFLHHFNPETNIRLLRKCHHALASGGVAAALEFIPNPDRVTPPMTAAFALTMLATTKEGDAYTFPEYEAMFSEAGFGAVELTEIPQSPHRIVSGRKM